MIAQDGPSQVVDMADEKGVLNSSQISYRGFAMDFKNQTLFSSSRDGQLPWRLTGGGDLQMALRRMNYLDPRLTFDFPSGQLIEKSHGTIRDFCSGKNFWKSEANAEQIVLTLFAGTFKDGEDKQRWVFDAKTSLPIEINDSAWHAGDKKFYPGDETRIEWDFVDDYDVVSRITSNEFVILDSIDGRSYGGFREQVVKLYWNSVNQELDERFFDGSVLKSQASLRRFLEQPEMKKGKKLETEGADQKATGDKNSNR
ncbi:MAG: hypothetical protein R3C03_18560 [Pirellulaceae bacterium]